ncbi:hypothetical protein L798_01830 [Zootermopsis nevadensis]|uniref:Uncharacterized protein n=3 Tax=Zootermopsis nevadensis TaxID=136037 RepID=A0A067RR58_ZOONE|nr:hypothetical protein L798_01830 [Zootermopsis nevadensis]
MKVNICHVYWTLLFVSFISSCLLFILVATESGVTDFSVRTLFDNDTVDTEHSADNSERLQNHGEQHEQTHGLNTNKKDENQEGKKHETVAEIHSSFEEEVSANNVDQPQSGDAASYIISPEPVSDITTE